MRLKDISVLFIALPAANAVDKVLEDVTGSHLNIDIYQLFTLVRTFRIKLLALDYAFLEEEFVSDFFGYFLPSTPARSTKPITSNTSSGPPKSMTVN